MFYDRYFLRYWVFSENIGKWGLWQKTTKYWQTPKIRKFAQLDWR